MAYTCEAVQSTAVAFRNADGVLNNFLIVDITIDQIRRQSQVISAPKRVFVRETKTEGCSIPLDWIFATATHQLIRI
jgi:hypothetical protein